jgi:hypothetical protein
MTAVRELIPGPLGIFSETSAEENGRVYDELVAVLHQLAPVERNVLLTIGRRLLAGQGRYGRLDLTTDRRDWRRERAEELADALVYGAIAEVASTLTKGTP